MIGKPKWNNLTFFLISFFAVLSLINWQKFPFFLDIYYHLNAMRGFDAAGGVVNHSFWELAPSGTTQVYPPLFHLLLLIPYKLGVGPLFIARSFSIASFIVLLLTLYFVVSRLFSKKLGFFVTMASCVPYTFFIKSTITIPSTLVLIFLLLAFYAVENGRKIAASLLIAASFYTHLGLPWLVIIIFLLYGLLRRERMKTILWTIFLSLLFSAPVLAHIFANLDKFESILGIKAGENELFEFYPMLYLLALIGLLKLKDRTFRDRGLFFIALIVGLAPMTINYRYRLISAEGLLPIVFFAGVGLARSYDYLVYFLESKKTKPGLFWFYIFFFLVFINTFSPTLSLYTVSKPPYEQKELKFYLRDSTATNLIPFYKKHLRPIEISLYNDETVEWLKIIEKNTAPDDIICSNYTYVGGMLSAFSGRANGARLFYEIKQPNRPIYEMGSSKLIVWLRSDDGNFSQDLDRCIKKYKCRVIAQTASAMILLNDSAPKTKPVKPLISTAASLSILLIVFVIIYYDLALARKKFNNLSRSSLE